jgi:hypothetical protein
MKAVNNLTTTNPKQLLNEGKVWLSIWELKRAENLFVACYCLFSALEFYLKAYLVLRNNVYKDTEKLKFDIGHDFGKLFEKIAMTGKDKFTKEINAQINKYELRTISLDRLKYPEDRKMWLIERGFEKGEHTLGNILSTIDREVTENFDKWLNDAYPKQIELSAMTQIGFEGKLEETDLSALSGICSKCFPANIILFEKYNFPWDKDIVPPKICTKCGQLFNPNGMRQKHDSEEGQNSSI